MSVFLVYVCVCVCVYECVCTCACVSVCLRECVPVIMAALDGPKALGSAMRLGERERNFSLVNRCLQVVADLALAAEGERGRYLRHQLLEVRDFSELSSSS